MASINSEGSAGSFARLAPRIISGTPFRVFASFGLLTTLLALVLNVAAQGTTTTSDTAQATPAASMPRIELQLNDVNESDLGGSVTLYEFGDQTIVDFRATGAGGDHPASILSGTCEAPTETARYDLEPVSNTGQSRTTINASLGDLLAQDHIVQINMSADDADTVIACAAVEGTPALESAATPAASPAASPEATAVASPESDGVGGTSTGNDGTGGPTDAETLTVKLVDWSDTGITGTAVFTGQGESTSVTVTLSGEAVTGDHVVHIHNGTCATPGSATYTLSPIDANGTSTSTVNLSLETLTTGSYFVNVHPDEANWDSWMACGNITGTATSVTSAIPTPASVSAGNQEGDGSAGGNTTMVATNAQAGSFPQTVGVGDGLRWPSDTRTAVIWAVGVSGIVILGLGTAIRSAEKSGRTPRFTRLGL